MFTRGTMLIAVLALILAVPAHADTPERVPIPLDTDIGTDIDDVFAPQSA